MRNSKNIKSGKRENQILLGYYNKPKFMIPFRCTLSEQKSRIEF